MGAGTAARGDTAAAEEQCSARTGTGELFPQVFRWNHPILLFLCEREMLPLDRDWTETSE